MAIRVNNIEDLKREMMRQVKSAMKAESDWLVNYTKDVVQRTVYDVYDPEVYKRTFNLKNSIDITKTKDAGNGYSMTVGHNLKGVYWHSVADYRKVGVPYIVHYGKYGIYNNQIGYDQYGKFPVYHQILPSSGDGWSQRRPYMDYTVKALKTSSAYTKQIASKIGSHVSVK